MIPVRVVVKAGRLELDKRKLKSVIRSAGREVKARTEVLLASGAGGGRHYGGVSASPYRPKHGPYNASAAGQVPVKVSGQIAGSIVVRVFKSGEGVAIRSNKFYAKFLETGARNGGGSRKSGNLLMAGEMSKDGRRILRGRNRLKKSATLTGRILAPRPFLTTALEQVQGTLATRIGAAINDGIKFKREKLKRR